MYRVEYGTTNFNERHQNCYDKSDALRVYEASKFQYRYVRILDACNVVASWVNYAEGAEEVCNF